MKQEYTIELVEEYEKRQFLQHTSRISDGSIVLVDKEIVGNLNFTRYEKK